MDKQKDENYSKGMWIAGIVLAVICIAVDVCSLAGLFGEGGDFMSQTAMFSLPLCLFVLVKCVIGLRKKIQEEG